MTRTDTIANTPEAWSTGPITLDGVAEVLGQYPLGHYWNGFLLPWIDPLAVITVLEDLNETNPNGPTLDWDWVDGNLILKEQDYSSTPGPDWALAEPQWTEEILEPDADGLYPLGAWAWVWSEAEDHTDHRIQEDHYGGLGHHVVRYCKDCGVTIP